jgi:hypothetical protein
MVERIVARNGRIIRNHNIGKELGQLFRIEFTAKYFMSIAIPSTVTSYIYLS